jgi:ribosomal protein S6
MNEEKDKKIYELALLLKSEEDLAGILAFLRDHSAEAISEPRAKKLALAYKINGHTEAVFASCTFRAAGEDAKSLEHDLQTRPQVIRSMVIIALPPSDRPVSAMPFSREQRTRPSSSMMRTSAASETKPAASRPLSNEALEKKIEEILR